jgi:RNA polymerase sigma-70 factor, ECF subfamily
MPCVTNAGSIRRWNSIRGSVKIGRGVGGGTDDGQDRDALVVQRSWTDPEAFAELFDRHADEIHRYAAWRVGRDVADDLLAETFAIAFQHRRRYDVGREDAWLYGIATNLVSRHRRSEARRLRAMSRELPPAGAGGISLSIARRTSTSGSATRSCATTA